MVCGDCEKKLGKIIGVDPYRNKAQNKTAGPPKKFQTTRNRLFGADKKLSIATSRCRICKQMVHQPGNHYCPTCAFQKGICTMCGKKISNTKETRQSGT